MEPMLHIAGLVEESIVDGPGIRFVVFAQGCKHHCSGCHNPETHSFSGGSLVSIPSLLELIQKNPLLDGLTISGGEPFEQAGSFASLADQARQRGLHIMTYTGYTYEEIILQSQKEPAWALLLANTDFLVDGPFQFAERDLLLRFKGSKNQRIIDVKESFAQGEVILASL